MNEWAWLWRQSWFQFFHLHIWHWRGPSQDARGCLLLRTWWRKALERQHDIRRRGNPA